MPKDKILDAIGPMLSMEGDIPLSPFDLHTRLSSELVCEEARTWKPLGPETVGKPKSMHTLEKYSVAPPFLATPKKDEDGVRIGIAEKAIAWSLRSLPLTDEATAWSSREEALKQMALQYEGTLPSVNVEWKNPTSDKTLSLMAFQGLGSHRLERIKDDSEGALFMVDTSWMAAFPVRESFKRYGACAFFDEKQQPVRIYTVHEDQIHYPKDTTWDEAKWCWRSSLFTAVTLVDHLGTTHYLSANLLITATREQLPPNHAFRRLLTPFGYGTVAINRDAFLTLSPERGLAHRTFALTYDGLVRCLLKGVESAELQTLPESLAAKGVESINDSVPYATDGLALYSILESYVQDYFAIYFPDKTALNDANIRSWWRSLIEQAPNLGLQPLRTVDQLIRLTTHFMFSVTGLHGQVGAVVDYTCDPTLVGPKLRAGETMSDVQATLQVLNLTVATGFSQPPMIGDYRHTLPDRERARAIAVFDKYQTSLEQLARDIESRNLTREQPFQTFNPTILDSSVSK